MVAAGIGAGSPSHGKGFGSRRARSPECSNAPRQRGGAVSAPSQPRPTAVGRHLVSGSETRPREDGTCRCRKFGSRIRAALRVRHVQKHPQVRPLTWKAGILHPEALAWRRSGRRVHGSLKGTFDQVNGARPGECPFMRDRAPSDRCVRMLERLSVLAPERFSRPSQTSSRCG